MRRIALAAAALVVCATTAVAASAQTAAPPTKQAGKLVVGFDLPAPAFWNGRASGNTIKHPTGFEHSLSLDIAKQLGISAANTFIYMRGYPSREERDRRLKAAHDDPEFAEVVTKQERNPDTKLIENVHNIDMVPSGAYASIRITQ